MKHKLTSRKFWLAVASFISSIVVLVVKDNDTAVQITSIITAAASIIAYLFAEGSTDAAALNLEYMDQELTKFKEAANDDEN